MQLVLRAAIIAIQAEYTDVQINILHSARRAIHQAAPIAAGVIFYREAHAKNAPQDAENA